MLQGWEGGDGVGAVVYPRICNLSDSNKHARNKRWGQQIYRLRLSFSLNLYTFCKSSGNYAMDVAYLLQHSVNFGDTHRDNKPSRAVNGSGTAPGGLYLRLQYAATSARGNFAWARAHSLHRCASCEFEFVLCVFTLCVTRSESSSGSVFVCGFCYVWCPLWSGLMVVILIVNSPSADTPYQSSRGEQLSTSNTNTTSISFVSSSSSSQVDPENSFATTKEGKYRLYLDWKFPYYFKAVEVTVIFREFWAFQKPDTDFVLF
ncbi:hypothetical protein J6590_093347 [Homalodisca vitripennis]|nr:hypothetical protein J6590_093347 [Homalodisca vitripennis]